MLSRHGKSERHAWPRCETMGVTPGFYVAAGKGGQVAVDYQSARAFYLTKKGRAIVSLSLLPAELPNRS